MQAYAFLIRQVAPPSVRLPGHQPQTTVFKICPQNTYSRITTNNFRLRRPIFVYRCKKHRIQKMPPKYISKNYNKQLPPILYPFIYFYLFLPIFINPHHNGRHVTTVLYFYHTIKVTRKDWEGGRRSE